MVQLTGRKIMNRRTFTTMALLGLALPTALPQAGLAQSHPMIGTWKLNLAKSKYSPGPPPRSNTVIWEAVGQGLRARGEGVDAQGNPTKTDTGVFSFDGKSYPYTGSPVYDASSWKQVNASTMEVTRTKAGRVVQTMTIVLSADGKSRTNTTTGVDEKGQQINDVAVFDKQ
jgi:hypothetical protein